MDSQQDKLEHLNWHCSAEQQAAARKYFVEDFEGDLSSLIQPFGEKGYWNNAALVFAEIGSPRIDPYLPKLLNWLMDMNWPGASVIFELLSGIDELVLAPALKGSIATAISEGDEDWFDSLHELSVCIGGEELPKEISPEVMLFKALNSILGVNFYSSSDLRKCLKYFSDQGYHVHSMETHEWESEELYYLRVDLSILGLDGDMDWDRHHDISKSVELVEAKLALADNEGFRAMFTVWV